MDVRRLGFYAAATLLVALLLLLAVTACSKGTSTGGGPGADDSRGGTRTDDDGSVTIKVTWDGRLQPLTFEVAMDTHSVDLDGYDLSTLAVLRTDRGNELRPAAWEAPKGGHHREGTLTFASQAAAGDGSYLELIIRDVGGKAERVFRWDMPGSAKGGP